MLQEQLQYIHVDDWMSLPEMTNHNGEFNRFSCRAQAWSVGCCLVAYEKTLSLFHVLKTNNLIAMASNDIEVSVHPLQLNSEGTSFYRKLIRLVKQLLKKIGQICNHQPI